MKKALIVAMVIAVSGCATVPKSGYTWTGEGYTIQAQRHGCEMNSFTVKNTSSALAKVSGTLDILDDKSNTVSTVQFFCDNAHPGGTAKCTRLQTYDEKAIMNMPGFYCAGYSQYKMSTLKF